MVESIIEIGANDLCGLMFSNSILADINNTIVIGLHHFIIIHAITKVVF